MIVWQESCGGTEPHCRRCLRCVANQRFDFSNEENVDLEFFFEFVEEIKSPVERNEINSRSNFSNECEVLDKKFPMQFFITFSSIALAITT